MEIFDSHLHLDSSADLDLSITNLIKNCNLAGVAGGLIICMQNEPWEFEAVAEKIVRKIPKRATTWRCLISLLPKLRGGTF